MGMYPGANGFRFVPGSVIPDDDDDLFVFTPGERQQVRQEGQGVSRVGLARGKGQRDLLRILTHSAVAGQRFVLRFGRYGRLYESQRATLRRPSMSLRLSKAAEPALILVKQQPVGMCMGLRF